MRCGGRTQLVFGGLVLVTAGCATGEQWATWQAHPAHFASADHLLFSIRNRQGTTPRVSRTDLALAGRESWWGAPVRVAQDEILER